MTEGYDQLNSIPWDGEVITKPGIYANIPLDAYHTQICDGPSVSSSNLRKVIHKSAAHFYDDWSGNPNHAPREEKRHYIFGSAAHHLFSGQKGFSSLFKVEPTQYEAEDGTMKPWHNGANACKLWHEQQRKTKLAILKPADAEDLIGMAAVFHRHPMLDPRNKKTGGLLHGLVERSIIWQDKETGIWIKVRPDVTPYSHPYFADFKTTTSTEKPDVQRSIEDYGYDMQADLILTGARKVLKMENPQFSLVFQEKKRPYCVRVLHCVDQMLARAAPLNRYALDIIASCLKSKIWPGPGGYREDAEPIDISERAQKRVEDILKYGI